MASMDAPARTETVTAAPVGGIRLNYEIVAYALLIALALALRIAELDTVPLNLRETHDALAAWRAISPEAPGDPLISSSPINHLLLAMGMATLGATEFAARILFVLFGTSILILPLAFRSWLGRTRTLLISFVLACSPTLLIASREVSGSTVALFLSVLMLWALWRLHVTGRGTYGAAAVVFAVMGAVLADTAGVWIVSLPIGALLIAAVWQRRAGQRFSFATDEDAAPTITPRSVISAIPWSVAIPVAALIVVAVATAFLLNADGLTTVGAVIAGWLGGFTTSSVPEAPRLYPLVTSLFYETFAWGLAVVSVIVLLRGFALGFVERFFIAWIGLGIVAAIVWPGGRADHAIWFAVPLAGLVAALLHTLLLADDPVNRVYYPAPYWARWVLALVVFGLLLAVASAFQGIGRALLAAPDGNLAAVVWDVPTVVLFVVTLLFIVVAFFMAGSLWDNGTALRGIGLGVAAFGLLTGLGAGWNAAVPYGDRAAELWRLQAVQRDNFLLRETLLQVAKREAGGTTELPVTVLAAQNGAVAWTVRDFSNADFITDMAEAAGDPVLLIGNGALPLDTGVPYVGQDFAQVHYWSPAVLFPGDMAAYWSQGLTRSALTGLANSELWLRQDIYDGVDPDQLPRG